MRLQRASNRQQSPMHALHWWATLAHESVDWLTETGQMRIVRRGTVVHCAEPLETVFVVLGGTLAVWRTGRSASDVESVYPGELLDDALATDMPFSTVTIVAVEDSCVFAANSKRLAIKLGDPAFAVRFYRALALVLAGSAEERTAQRTGAGRRAAAVRDDSGSAIAPARARHARRSFRATGMH